MLNPTLTQALDRLPVNATPADLVSKAYDLTSHAAFAIDQGALVLAVDQLVAALEVLGHLSDLNELTRVVGGHNLIAAIEAAEEGEQA